MMSLCQNGFILHSLQCVMNGQLDTFCAKVLLISAVFMACTTRLNSSMQCFSLRVPHAEISSEVWLFEAVPLQWWRGQLRKAIGNWRKPHWGINAVILTAAPSCRTSMPLHEKYRQKKIYILLLYQDKWILLNVAASGLARSMLAGGRKWDRF